LSRNYRQGRGKEVESKQETGNRKGINRYWLSGRTKAKSGALLTIVNFTGQADWVKKGKGRQKREDRRQEAGGRRQEARKGK
jgi:hypothetical protein